MTNCFILEIPIKSSVFDDLKGTTVSPFVYAVFPSPDVYMEGAMCIKLIFKDLVALLFIKYVVYAVRTCRNKK